MLVLTEAWGSRRLRGGAWRAWRAASRRSAEGWGAKTFAGPLAEGRSRRTGGLIVLRQKKALKAMGKPWATNHSGKRGAGRAHSTKDLEQDEEPSSAQQRAAKKKVRTSHKRYKGVKRGPKR